MQEKRCSGKPAQGKWQWPLAILREETWWGAWRQGDGHHSLVELKRGKGRWGGRAEDVKLRTGLINEARVGLETTLFACPVPLGCSSTGKAGETWAMLKIVLLLATISPPHLEHGVWTRSRLPALPNSQGLVSTLIFEVLGGRGAGAVSVGLAPSPPPPPQVSPPHPCCAPGAGGELSCPLWEMEKFLPCPQAGYLPSPSAVGYPPALIKTSAFKGGPCLCSLASLCGGAYGLLVWTRAVL